MAVLNQKTNAFSSNLKIRNKLRPCPSIGKPNWQPKKWSKLHEICKMCPQRTTYLPTCRLKISTTNLRWRACITRKSHTNRTQNSQVIAKYSTGSRNCQLRRPFLTSRVTTINLQAKVGNKTQIRSLDLITAKHSKKLKAKQQTLPVVLCKVRPVETPQSLLSEYDAPKTSVQMSPKWWQQRQRSSKVKEIKNRGQDLQREKITKLSKKTKNCYKCVTNSIWNRGHKIKLTDLLLSREPQENFLKISQ